MLLGLPSTASSALTRAYDRESTHSPVGLNPNWSVARHDSRTWPTRPHPSQRALGAPGATALGVLDLDDFAARPTSSSLLESARLRPEPTSSRSRLCRRRSFLYLLSLIHSYHFSWPMSHLCGSYTSFLASRMVSRGHFPCHNSAPCGWSRATCVSWTRGSNTLQANSRLTALIAAGAGVLGGKMVPTVVCLAPAADEMGDATCADTGEVEVVPTVG